MVRTILTLTMVAVLLATGPASAAEDSAPFATESPSGGDSTGSGSPSQENSQDNGDTAESPTGGGTGGAPQDPSPSPLGLGAGSNPVDAPDVDVGAAVDTAREVVANVEQEIGNRLVCRDAVKIDRHWWGGTYTDFQKEDRTWIHRHTWNIVTERQVPVYRDVPVVGRLLDGVGLTDSAPVTTERVIDHYVTVEDVRSETRSVRFAGEVHRAYTEWERYTDTWYVDPLVGAPFLNDGSGHLVEVCDNEVDIVRHVSDPDTSDVDRWCWCRHNAPEDGWSWWFRTIDAWFATTEDLSEHPAWTWHWDTASWGLYEAAVGPLGDLLFGPEDPEFVPAVTDEASTDETTASSSAVPLATRATNIAALSAIGVLAALGVALAARRHFR